MVCQVCRIDTETIMNVQIRQGQYNDDYAYFDPKILRGNMDNIPRAKNAFQVRELFLCISSIISN